MKLRARIAKFLDRLSLRIYNPPVPEPLQPYKSVKEILQPTQGAVVEANNQPVQWKPKQSGNVVIAEPILMSKHRRGEI